MAPSEGADTCHEGSNDHIRRSISVATLILRQDERGGAAIEGAMVLFVIRYLTRESKRRIRDIWPKSVEIVALNKPMVEINRTKGTDLLPRTCSNIEIHKFC